MRKGYKHIFSTISLLLMLFVCQANIYGFVWCFCDQDATKLEQLHFDCNQSCPSEHEAPEDDHPSHHISRADHTGPCLDLSTSGSYTTARQRDDFFKQQIALSACPVEPVFSDGTETVNHSLPNHIVTPRISQQILHHRTIVLRH